MRHFVASALDQEEVVGCTDGSANAVVIWTHGLGDTPKGWSVKCATWGTHEGLSRVKFRLPCAPEQPVTCNGGKIMTSWMDINEIPIRVNSSDTGRHLDASIAKIHAMIDQETAGGIPAERIVLGGFSQGGALSLCAAMRCRHRLGGCVSFSGWAPQSQSIGALVAGSVNRSIPIFIGQGGSDRVVLAENAAHMTKLLRGAGADQVQGQMYRNMQHTVCPQQETDICKFLAQALPPGMAQAMRAGGPMQQQHQQQCYQQQQRQQQQHARGALGGVPANLQPPRASASAKPKTKSMFGFPW